MSSIAHEGGPTAWATRFEKRLQAVETGLARLSRRLELRVALACGAIDVLGYLLRKLLE